MTISVASPIGNYLRQRRILRGLSQRDLADALKKHGFDYAQPTLGSWERGRFMPPIDDPDFVKVLADILGVSESDVLEAAGFALTNSSAPDDFDNLPEEIRETLKALSPDELNALVVLVRGLSARNNKDKADQ